MADSTPSLTPLRRLFRLFQLERREIASLYVFALMVGLFSLAVPLGVQALVGLVSGGLLLQPVVILILFVVAGSAFSGYLQWLQVAVAERIQQRIFVRTAFDFARRIPRWKLEALGAQYAGELPNRFFDVMNVQKGVAKILMDFVAALLQFVFGLLLLTFYHPYFIVFGGVMLLLLWLMFRFTGQRGLSTSIDESKYKYRVAYWLQNLARTLPHGRLMQQPITVHKTDALVAGYLTQRQSHFRVLSFQYGALFVFKTLVIAGLLTMGSLLVTDRQINLGQFVAAEFIIVLILGSVEKIVLNLDTVYDLLTGLAKVGEVEDIPLQRETCFECLPTQPTTGIAIRFEAVTLEDSYGLKVLDEATFQVAAGEKIGVVTDSPETVRRLFQLLSGVWDAYEGLVSLDGFGLRELTPDSLSEQVAAALDTRALFAGTIAENLNPAGPTGDITALQPYLRALYLADAIERLPGGLAQQIYPGGWGIDPRMAQRMVLLRAVAGQPRLLLVNGLLDAQPLPIKEALVQYLTAENPNQTLLLASQDPQVLMACSKVLVIRGGRAVLYDEPAQGLTLVEDHLVASIPSEKLIQTYVKNHPS